MNRNMINATINGHSVSAPSDSTILQVAEQEGIFIPTLCHDQRLKPYGGCRVCQVELKMAGHDKSIMTAACTQPLNEGDIIYTDTAEVIESRRFILQLLLAKSPRAKAIQELAEKYNIPDSPEKTEDQVETYLAGEAQKRIAEAGEENVTKCMLCGLCTRVCREIVNREAINMVNRSDKRRVRPPFGDVSPTCIGCGSCAYICPNDAIIIERAE